MLGLALQGCDKMKVDLTQFFDAGSSGPRNQQRVDGLTMDEVKNAGSYLSKTVTADKAQLGVSLLRGLHVGATNAEADIAAVCLKIHLRLLRHIHPIYKLLFICRRI